MGGSIVVFRAKGSEAGLVHDGNSWSSLSADKGYTAIRQWAKLKDLQVLEIEREDLEPGVLEAYENGRISTYFKSERRAALVLMARGLTVKHLRKKERLVKLLDWLDKQFPGNNRIRAKAKAKKVVFTIDWNPIRIKAHYLFEREAWKFTKVEMPRLNWRGDSDSIDRICRIRKKVSYLKQMREELEWMET